MTFTKTSQKFGQWIDFKLNLVYGLGFSNDAELNKVRINYYKNSTEYWCETFWVPMNSIQIPYRN